MRKQSEIDFFLKLIFPHKLIIIFYAVFLIAGIFVGQIAKDPPIIISDNPQELRLKGNFKFINPLLECDTNQSSSQEHKPSRKTVVDLINNKKSKGEVKDIAVYYRDLNNGPWLGIDEKINFTPASLLKLPVMMAFYKKAESNPVILKKQITLKEGQTVLEPFFMSEKSLEAGKTYSIDELINRMIIYSDNDALFLLEQNIDNDSIDNITKDLGIETATETTPEDYMSVKSYASLFRVLFNASYLNRNFSEKALEVLSKVTFNEGINRGVPNNLLIAHKFGERELENGTKQLHDCGIIYVPNHPYLLCVMARGSDYTKISNAIGDISKVIYESVIANTK
jgi:beta-lactamase class A